MSTPTAPLAPTPAAATTSGPLKSYFYILSSVLCINHICIPLFYRFEGPLYRFVFKSQLPHEIVDCDWRELLKRTTKYMALYTALSCMSIIFDTSELLPEPGHWNLTEGFFWYYVILTGLQTVNRCLDVWIERVKRAQGQQ